MITKIYTDTFQLSLKVWKLLASLGLLTWNCWRQCYNGFRYLGNIAILEFIHFCFINEGTAFHHWNMFTSTTWTENTVKKESETLKLKPLHTMLSFTQSIAPKISLAGRGWWWNTLAPKEHQVWILTLVLFFKKCILHFLIILSITFYYNSSLTKYSQLFMVPTSIKYQFLQDILTLSLLSIWNRLNLPYIA